MTLSGGSPVLKNRFEVSRDDSSFCRNETKATRSSCWHLDTERRQLHGYSGKGRQERRLFTSSADKKRRRLRRQRRLSRKMASDTLEPRRGRMRPEERRGITIATNRLENKSLREKNSAKEKPGTSLKRSNPKTGTYLQRRESVDHGEGQSESERGGHGHRVVAERQELLKAKPS